MTHAKVSPQIPIQFLKVALRTIGNNKKFPTRVAVIILGLSMKYLLDTNIIVPLEPASKIDLEVNTDLALEFYRLAAKAKQDLFVHPQIGKDIDRDKDQNRADLRRKLINRYQQLQRPPSLNSRWAASVGNPPASSNDWVDNELLGSVEGNAVDYLVTEDAGIHRKARRIGIQGRVLTLAEAVTSIRDLFDAQPTVPPAVQLVNVYEVDSNDPIFDSLRADYAGFDNWLAKCQREHRVAYVVRDNPTANLAGICILKSETPNDYGLEGRVMKLCLFKVSERHNGNRYGELLLKPVFDFLWENSYDHAYITAFEKQTALIDFFNAFGFDPISAKTSLNETVLVKRLKPSADEKLNLSPCELNRKFGPWVTKFERNKTYIVPIQPRYHNILFPEYEAQQVLSIGLAACGNSIRKAYLSNSAINTIRACDNLVFYRSSDQQGATVLGIVEDVLRSSDSDSIARFVGKRTVYNYSQIKSMCERSEVLALKFKRVLFFDPFISLPELISHNCVISAPQSIQQFKEKGTEWLAQKLKM